MEDELRAALRAAMRSRDPVATAALRSALGTLANATAVPVPPTGGGPGGGVGSEHVAGGVAGLGAAEVPRRELSAAEAVDLLRAEVAERRAAAAHHPPASAARLHAEADVLEELIPQLVRWDLGSRPREAP